MLYNDIISYNEPNVIYDGTLVIRVPGILNPISVYPIVVIIDPIQDYSNFTTVAVTSVEVSGTGIVTIETSDQNAEALIGSTVVVVRPSGEISIGSI
jgi:hypothetical protein